MVGMCSDEQILTGFAPVFRPDARVLVLGSMPGVASLQAHEYYAHPRNAFWPIMHQLCGASPELPYAQRLQCLVAGGIAVWDVLQRCRRTGSLDSRIRRAGLHVNDIAMLIEQCRDLRCICLNGNKAAGLFRRQVLPQLWQSAPVAARLAHIECHDMPSTSPAYATMSLARKLEIWQQVVQPLLAANRAIVARPQHGVAD